MTTQWEIDELQRQQAERAVSGITCMVQWLSHLESQTTGA